MKSTVGARVGAEGYQEGVRVFLNAVMGYMAFGLLITALAASFVSGSLTYLDGKVVIPAWYWPAVIAEFVMIMYIVPKSLAGKGRMGFVAFLAFTALSGATIAPAVAMYTPASIVKSFFIAATLFGASAFYGAVTRRNLGTWERGLTNALWGLIALLVFGIFFPMPLLDIGVTIFGIAVFAGFTAYDVYRLEQMYNERAAATSDGLAVYGALILYLDILNLFLFFLRFFGVKTSS